MVIPINYIDTWSNGFSVYLRPPSKWYDTTMRLEIYKSGVDIERLYNTSLLQINGLIHSSDLLADMKRPAISPIHGAEHLTSGNINDIGFIHLEGITDLMVESMSDYALTQTADTLSIATPDISTTSTLGVVIAGKLLLWVDHPEITINSYINIPLETIGYETIRSTYPIMDTLYEDLAAALIGPYSMMLYSNYPLAAEETGVYTPVDHLLPYHLSKTLLYDETGMVLGYRDLSKINTNCFGASSNKPTCAIQAMVPHGQLTSVKYA